VEALSDMSEEDNKMKYFSFRFRAYVCRAPNNKPITTTPICGIERKNHQINDGNIASQSFSGALNKKVNE
jgi:hypothetical protein